MSFGDLSRINTNVQAMQANTFLQRTNQDIGLRQLRLATGSQLNRAEDDSAGYSISKKLEAKVRGQAQALSNIGDAKSMLTVGEGALNSVMDILQTMKEKTVQAANATMGDNERDAIQSQLTELSSEVDRILGSAEFNGINLFAGDPDDADDPLALSFQIGASSSDTFAVNLNALTSEILAIDVLDVTNGDDGDHAAAIDAVDAAINTVSSQLAGIGDSQSRLTFQQENLQVSMTNYESARSRISDADFAKEQMELVKLQILQQTGTAALAQANAAPQAVLSLF
jgi:flagellin